MQSFEERHGMRIIQGWDMTETSPLAAVAHVPAGADEAETWDWRARTGRLAMGLRMRIVGDDGPELPWDGEAVDLENALMAHPAVFKAAVVAVPDERWDERPLACVVLRPDADATPAELREHLGAHVARWQLPERWTFIPAVPKTSVGKFDKKVLRRQYAEEQLEVTTVDG
jgi:fatty-acyl-CoA synthase